MSRHRNLRQYIQDYEDEYYDEYESAQESDKGNLKKTGPMEGAANETQSKQQEKSSSIIESAKALLSAGNRPPSFLKRGSPTVTPYRPSFRPAFRPAFINQHQILSNAGQKKGFEFNCGSFFVCPVSFSQGTLHGNPKNGY